MARPSFFWPRGWIYHLFVLLLVFGNASLGAEGGTASLLRKIDTKDFGGLVLRFADLNADGSVDILAAQNFKREITLLTAFDLEGKILWQKGQRREPPRGYARTSSDLPVQIRDLDGDGKPEIVLVFEGALEILEGSTGSVRKSVPVSDTLDAIYFVDFWGATKAPAIVSKTRYTHFWVYDSQLNLLWDKDENTGHIPFAYDVDRDGLEELLVGYALYDRRGGILWRLRDFPDHLDAADAGDMDGDGVDELGIATGRDAYLVTPKGTTLWQRPAKHMQHVVIGSFRADLPGQKQAVFLDKMNQGRFTCYDAKGTTLYESRPQGGSTILSAVDGWSGKRAENYVMAYRRNVGPPALFDCSGRKVAEFPFPPAVEGKEYGTHYVQHFDILGDGREEILVSNEKEIWIYANGAPAPAKIDVSEKLPNRRIYNASFYSGMQ